MTDEFSWCRHSKFSLMPAKIFWSAIFILVTEANDVTNWRLKLGISSLNFNFISYLEVEILKEGINSQWTYCIRAKVCNRMVDPLLCARIYNIRCGRIVRPPFFWSFTYGYEIGFYPGMSLVKGWQLFKVWSIIKVNNKCTRKYVAVSLLLTFNIFHTLL